MLTGLARDGGLYVPEDVPTLSPDEIAALAGLPYEEAALPLRPSSATPSPTRTSEAIAAAYAGFGHAARAPLVQLGRTTSCSNCSTAPRSPSRTSRCR
jgi:threonine synthase